MSPSIQSDALFVGQPTLHFDTLPSSNDYLKTLVAKGKSVEGLTVQCDYQTLGRGQIGNSWQSNAGENLLFSVYLTPKGLSASDYFYLNMSVCLAVIDALNYLAPGFVIKWPNDVLYDKKKVAGILIESTITSANVQSSIIGIGLNVNQQNFVQTGGFEPGSLRTILGQQMDRQYILKILLKSIEVRYLQLRRDFNTLKTDYHQFLYGHQQSVKAKVNDKVGELKILQILKDGQLKAEFDGLVRNFVFKELSFLP